MEQPAEHRQRVIVRGQDAIPDPAEGEGVEDRGDAKTLAALDPASATPPGVAPPLKIFMGNTDTKTFCNAVSLTDQAPVGQLPGGWFQYSIPLAAWQCPNLGNVDTFGFANDNALPAHFCVDKISIVASNSAR